MSIVCFTLLRAHCSSCSSQLLHSCMFYFPAVLVIASRQKKKVFTFQKFRALFPILFPHVISFLFEFSAVSFCPCLVFSIPQFNHGLPKFGAFLQISFMASRHWRHCFHESVAEFEEHQLLFKLLVDHETMTLRQSEVKKSADIEHKAAEASAQKDSDEFMTDSEVDQTKKSPA